MSCVFLRGSSNVKTIEPVMAKVTQNTDIESTNGCDKLFWKSDPIVVKKTLTNLSQEKAPDIF